MAVFFFLLKIAKRLGALPCNMRELHRFAQHVTQLGHFSGKKDDLPLVQAPPLTKSWFYVLK